MYMHDKKLYGTATVGSKGQVVIPSDARKVLDIKEGDRLYVVGSEKGGWVGFISEDQLQQMIGRLTDSLETFTKVKDEL